MKKTFLTTTAIIAAFAATDAQADSLQVNVGGYADFQAGYTTDDAVEAADANQTNFNTDAEIHFSVEGASDNGLEYGAVVELEANVGDGSDNYDNGTNADKAYLFVQGGWGRVEMGENTGAEEALAVNTGNFASATGGVEGDFYRYISAPTTAGDNAATISAALVTAGFDQTDTTADVATVTLGSSAIIKPKLISAHSGTSSLGDAADEDATKITYYSPRFAGFQLGASYTANSNDTSRSGSADVTTTGNEDVFSGGINYTTQYEEIGIAASLTGLVGDAKTAGVADSFAAATYTAATGGTDIEGYAAGLNLTFAGFTLGGSYGDYQDSLGSVDSTYYDLGLGYTVGAFSTSVTYLNSEVDGTSTITVADAGGLAANADVLTLNQNSEFENLVIGADYQLAPGLVPYAEVAFYEYEAGTTDNEGTVVMLGTQLSF